MPLSRVKSRPAPGRPPLAFIPFQLPSLVNEAPSGPGWIHEIKLDGYRTQLIVDRNEARAFTRNGLDWTDRYSSLVNAARRLQVKSIILDGEAVVQDDSGVTDFNALRSAILTDPHRVTFFAFDLLHLNGQDRRRDTLLERRAVLASVLGKQEPHSAIQFSEAVAGSGPTVFAAAAALGVEGIVSKRTAGRYESGRSRQWVKTKAFAEEEFVVVGVEPNPGGPPFALLAREDAAGKLAYAGSAFVTLPKAERERFWEATEMLKIPRPVLREIKRAKVGFLKPELRVRTKYLKGEGMLRHASLVDIAERQS